MTPYHLAATQGSVRPEAEATRWVLAYDELEWVDSTVAQRGDTLKCGQGWQGWGQELEVCTGER